MGRGKEDKTPEITDILSIVGEVGIKLEIEVYVEINSAYDGKTVAIALLKQY